MNVSEEVAISSPGSTPIRRIATCSAAVPDAHATACLLPTYSANSFSKRSTNGPTDDTKFVARHSSRYFRVFPGRLGSDSGTNVSSDMQEVVLVAVLVRLQPLGGEREAAL